MNDYLGNKINLGDSIVHASGTSGGLSKGVVIKITPARVAVISHARYDKGERKGGSYVPPENVVVVGQEAKHVEEVKRQVESVIETITKAYEEK